MPNCSRGRARGARTGARALLRARPLTCVYVDTNIFLYAIGTEDRYREPCWALVQALAGDQLTGETSAATIQEIVHHRRRRGDLEATERGRRAAALCTVVRPFDWDILIASLELIDRHQDLPTRDAVHAATAIATRIDIVVSADRDFDPLPGLARVDPPTPARLRASCGWPGELAVRGRP